MRHSTNPRLRARVFSFVGRRACASRSPPSVAPRVRVPYRAHSPPVASRTLARSPPSVASACVPIRSPPTGSRSPPSVATVPIRSPPSVCALALASVKAPIRSPHTSALVASVRLASLRPMRPSSLGRCVALGGAGERQSGDPAYWRAADPLARANPCLGTWRPLVYVTPRPRGAEKLNEIAGLPKSSMISTNSMISRSP